MVFWKNNPPWAAGTTEAIVTASWPKGLLIVDLPTTGGTFAQRMDAACSAAPGPCVVRLPPGVHHLTKFRLAGRSGRQDFAFGYFHPKWLGWVGSGAASTIVQMDAGSVSAAQLAHLSTMTAASFDPSELSVALMQPTDASTVYLGGITIRAADQPFLVKVAPDLAAKGIITPQPAPHGGIMVGPGKRAVFSYVRFAGASRAMYAAPPFEHGAVSTQYSPSILLDHCEIDGRRAPELDAKQPYRGGLVMGNNDWRWELRDCWLHHCNVSRIAVNDENRETHGTYRFVRTKVNNVGNRNIDPKLNGGKPLGGATSAVVAGFESVSGVVEFIDCDFDVNNPDTTTGISQHLGFTSTGTRNPHGGRLYVIGGTWRNAAFKTLAGWVTIRALPTTAWVMDGYDATMDVRTAAGVRLQPWVYSGAWPPTTAQMLAAGVSKSTHYLVRHSVR